MDEENVRHQGSSPLFAIFCISLLTLFLIPYTLMKICGGEGEKTAKAVKVSSSIISCDLQMQHTQNCAFLCLLQQLWQ